jgi:hypothetical protein
LLLKNIRNFRTLPDAQKSSSCVKEPPACYATRPVKLSLSPFPPALVGYLSNASVPAQREAASSTEESQIHAFRSS